VVIAGEIAITATGAGDDDPPVTVSVAVPLCPSLVARNSVVPALTPSARPSAATVATAGFDEVQETVRSASGLPPASRGVATN
jgi:hypothetical protein